MKNLLIIPLLFLSSFTFAQNLYLVFDPNEPDVTKDVRKYLGKRGSTTPIMRTCGVIKISEYYYSYHYYFYSGQGLKLKKVNKTTPVYTTVVATQNPNLYPNAMNGAQLDQAMQSIIEQEYAMTAPFPKNPEDYPTVQYFEQFQKIFVIEYLGNGQAQVVEVEIANSFE
jgi:hypothetical protein